MNPNRYSVALLLVLITCVALFVWVLKLAIDGQSIWATVVSAGVLLVVLNFGFFGMIYIGLYPLGHFDRLMDEKLKVPQSPFASDRLPKQIIPTRDNENAH